jgi:threonine/homoserine/homoserine lactone efflux protein
MEMITLSTIVVASAINSAMPGPCVALTIGRSARDGAPAGFLVTIGVVLANFILCCIALSVMLGVLALSQSAFAAMKWIGITALVALALRMLANRGRSKHGSSVMEADWLRDLGAGLMVGLSSPFNLVFLLALLPQLVPAQDHDTSSIVLISTAVLAGAIVSQCGAVLIGAASGGVMRSAGRRIECLGALSMISFAAVAIVTPIA